MNYIEILKEALEEIRFNFNSDEIVLMIVNARYYWTTKSLEYYSNKIIKVIERPLYSPDLNPIEKIWTFMKKKQLEEKRYAISINNRRMYCKQWMFNKLLNYLNFFNL